MFLNQKEVAIAILEAHVRAEHFYRIVLPSTNTNSRLADIVVPWFPPLESVRPSTNMHLLPFILNFSVVRLSCQV
ncbi:DUF4042 domain-containing protein [Psidium guajava]|nr:DUF4042 domain-containing protein [Psidium guajava]